MFAHNVTAIQDHQPENFNFFISPEEINSTNEEGYTLLQLAAREGQEAIVLFLINEGADIDLISAKILKTPLYLALENQHDTIAEILLLCQADIHKTLQAAKFYNNAEIAINVNKAIIDLANSRLSDPLLYRSILCERTTVLNLIISNPNLKINLDRLLELALFKNTKKVIPLLLKDSSNHLQVSNNFGYLAIIGNKDLTPKEIINQYSSQNIDWVATLKQLHANGYNNEFECLYLALDKELKDKFFVMQESKEENISELTAKQNHFYKKASSGKKIHKLCTEVEDIYAVLKYAYQQKNFVALSCLENNFSTEIFLKAINNAHYDLAIYLQTILPMDFIIIANKVNNLSIHSWPDKFSLLNKIISRISIFKNNPKPEELYFIKQFTREDIFNALSLTLNNRYNIKLPSGNWTSENGVNYYLKRSLPESQFSVVANRFKRLGFSVETENTKDLLGENKWISFTGKDIWKNIILEFLSAEDLQEVAHLSYSFYELFKSLNHDSEWQRNFKLQLLTRELTLLETFILHADNDLTLFKNKNKTNYRRLWLGIFLTCLFMTILSSIGLGVSKKNCDNMFDELDDTPIDPSNGKITCRSAITRPRDTYYLGLCRNNNLAILSECMKFCNALEINNNIFIASFVIVIFGAIGTLLIPAFAMDIKDESLNGLINLFTLDRASLITKNELIELTNFYNRQSRTFALTEHNSINEILTWANETKKTQQEKFALLNPIKENNNTEIKTPAEVEIKIDMPLPSTAIIANPYFFEVDSADANNINTEEEEEKIPSLNIFSIFNRNENTLTQPLLPKANNEEKNNFSNN